MAEGLNEKPENGNGGGGATTPAARALPIIVPIVALLIYIGFVVYMLTRSDATTEIIWQRLVYVFSGIESIAFAAAGFLFGREVNRARAENAERLAKTEQNRADNASRQRDQAKARVRELSEGIRDLVDLTDEAEGAAPGGLPLPGAGMAPPGGGNAPASRASADATPVILSVVAKKARRLSERSRSLDLEM